MERRGQFLFPCAENLLREYILCDSFDQALTGSAWNCTLMCVRSLLEIRGKMTLLAERADCVHRGRSARESFMTVCRWLTAAVLVLGALAGIGEAIPRWMISPGMERYPTDPVAYAVAQAAYDTVWMLNDNPIGRLFIPGAGSGGSGAIRATVPTGSRAPCSRWPSTARRSRPSPGLGYWGPMVHVWCGGCAFGYKLPGPGQ